MITPATDPATMPGRDVLAAAIRAFDDRAAFGVSVSEAYGAACVAPGLLRNMEMDHAVANILRVLMARGAARIEDLPRDKEGKPQFVAKLRRETTVEIVQLVAGALRVAFVKHPDVPDPEGTDDT